VERPLLSWDEVYKNARKSERLKPEGNERDEGELERTGQPVCIYEIYSGEGAWPFLHHGSLYRGVTLVSLGKFTSLHVLSRGSYHFPLSMRCSIILFYLVFIISTTIYKI